MAISLEKYYQLVSLEPPYAHLQILRCGREEKLFSSLAGCTFTICVTSVMNFCGQNVTEFDISAARMAMVPLVLLVVLVFTIPPQLAMAVVLS